jgi:Na+-transporting methylmalonyl-CoA/oxaloacetate decarboxylase gamma subunit
MEKPSDDVLFSDIPGQGGHDNPSLFTSCVEKLYSKTQAEKVNVKYSCGDEDAEAVKRKKFIAAAESLVREKSSNAFREIVSFIHTRLINTPFRIGSFPPSEHTFQYVFRPEWSSEDIVVTDNFNFFNHEIDRASEYEFLPEMTKLRETHKKLHSPVKRSLILPIVFLLYSIAMLGLAYQWQLAGYPMLFVEFLKARGLSEARIAEFWLAPPLLIGVIIPVIAFVGFYLRSSFRHTMAATGTACIVVGFDVYYATCSIIPQSIAYWIFLGYFVLLVLVWLIAVIRSLCHVISQSAHKKEFAKEFLDAMDQQGRIVYGFIRLVTLWYQHEYNTDQTPALVNRLSQEYEAFFREAQSLDR